jgi:hypothetical protein
VASHKVAMCGWRRGLLEHVINDSTDQQQLPSMLKQAALQTHTSCAAGSAAAGSSSSGASRSTKPGSSVGAGSSRPAADDAGSSSGSSCKAGRDQLPAAGECSLTDTELLMVLEQLAAAKANEEQLALYQVS